jgi:plasmid maintenance system antidote protein VapI
MALETSLDLLNRLRARHDDASWYRLAKIIEASESTVNNWKHGRSAIGREYVTRIAELLEEPAEYVLACVEHEREQDAGARKLWRRIAERFRSTASILLVGLALLTVAGKASAADVGVVLGWDLSNTQSIHYAQFRAYLRRLLRKLMRCLDLGLKSNCVAPLYRLCARIRWKRSAASPPPSWRISPAFI